MGAQTPLDRPVALVTGGSRGIGRGICLELGKSGYAVAVNFAGNAEAAHETQRLLGPEQFLYGFVLALILGLVGGFFPALRAARTPILKIGAE